MVLTYIGIHTGIGIPTRIAIGICGNLGGPDTLAIAIGIRTAIGNTYRNSYRNMW